MDVFEIVTKKLRSVHDENDFINLEKVSEDYYQADLENNKIVARLAQSLSQEEVETINQLYDNFTTKEVIAGDLYYNQGFSDAIRLFVHALIWEPIRR